MARTMLLLLAVIFALCAGCGDDDASAGADAGKADAGKTDAGADSGNSSALSACDPFAPHMLPIMLGKLLGAGKDTQGTIYVADQPAGVEARVFVSSDKQLVRQRIAGAGSSGDNMYDFAVTDHEPAFTLQIEGAYPDSVRMGILEGSLADRKSFTIGQDGEELSIVPKSEVTALALRNLPGDVVLEYADQLADGRLLVVTSPQDDASYEDFRVFLGPKDGLVELRLIQVSRAKSGSTFVTFNVNGEQAEASFPFNFTDDGGVAGTPSITIGGKTQDMVALDARPAGAHYLCFAR